MTHSRNKGQRGETAVKDIYRDNGIPARRVGNAGSLADVVGVPGVHVEVKMAGVIRILDWLKQAEAEAPEGIIPSVHFRQCSRSRSSGWYVAVPLDDFIGLVKEAKS